MDLRVEALERSRGRKTETGIIPDWIRGVWVGQEVKFWKRSTFRPNTF